MRMSIIKRDTAVSKLLAGRFPEVVSVMFSEVVLVMFSEVVSDLFRTCFGLVSDSFRTRFGCVFGGVFGTRFGREQERNPCLADGQIERETSTVFIASKLR